MNRTQVEQLKTMACFMPPNFAKVLEDAIEWIEQHPTTEDEVYVIPMFDTVWSMQNCFLGTAGWRLVARPHRWPYDNQPSAKCYSTEQACQKAHTTKEPQ